MQTRDIGVRNSVTDQLPTETRNVNHTRAVKHLQGKIIDPTRYSVLQRASEALNSVALKILEKFDVPADLRWNSANSKLLFETATVAYYYEHYTLFREDLDIDDPDAL